MMILSTENEIISKWRWKSNQYQKSSNSYVIHAMFGDF